MTAAATVLRRPAAKPAEPAFDIRAFAAGLAANRFLPLPSEHLSVGDGDFRAIGAEFLVHFVELGGLQRGARMLDIGCGLGRMAIPLTQYLDPERGSYEGIDPVEPAVDWCAATVTPVYPNFRFRHLDLRNSLYNPGGILDGVQVTLPFAARRFDFIAMVSVETHLPADEVSAYAAECARLLAPGGRVFVTAFALVGPATRSADGRLAFAGEGPERHADPKHKMAAVAFADGFLEAAFGGVGLTLAGRHLGTWRGGSAGHYQDIFVFEKPGPGR